MKKMRILLMCLPLLLSSCTTARQRKISLGSVAAGSSKSGPKAGSSAWTSHDFGSDPTSIYEREEKQLIDSTPLKGDTVHIPDLVMEDYCWEGPVFMLKDDDSYVNVDTVGQEDTGASVRGLSSGRIIRAYDGWTGEPLDGRSFKGIPGIQPLSVRFSGEITRHPSEAFIRLVYVAQDNLEAITGYALIAAYPCGEPVEATDPNADIRYPELSERAPGPVWLDWKAEVVCEGVHFPKVEGLYQMVDPDRVEAALDIMIENAKGHYFQKAN